VTDKKSPNGMVAPLSLSDILREMNTEGGFTRSVLATAEGLAIASAPVDSDQELASAMVAMLQKISADTQDNLGLAPVDEVTIRTEERSYLVCRTIPSGADWVSLLVIVPPGQAYRRATNKAMRKIESMVNL
jgi:predicted regulator of Ras-like GTPase activity (Roadblock/LC7/MglB family)